jgi:hypothetical protein
MPMIQNNLRLNMLTLLWQEGRNMEDLAGSLGCSFEIMHKWLAGDEAPCDECMAQILEYALRNSPGARELFRMEVLEELRNLLAAAARFYECDEGQHRDLGDVIDTVDEKSRQIVWYVWWNRYADISELAELTRAESDMDVIQLIKNAINPAARSILGRDIMRFESSRTDPMSGEKVLFKWWLDDCALREKRQEPLVDIFQENEHIAIVAQLPTPLQLAREGRVESKNGVLKITVEIVK